MGRLLALTHLSSRTKKENMNLNSPLYHDDIKVGISFTTGQYTLTEDELVGFASRYDPQPFHTDPEAAKATLFGGLAASGWHTAAITMKLLVEHGLELSGGIVGAGCELSWPAPTRPGDTLQVEGKVIEVTPSPAGRKRGFITMRSETRTLDGVVVQIMVAKLAVERRPE
jgi:acyl dehydratase